MIWYSNEHGNKRTPGRFARVWRVRGRDFIAGRGRDGSLPVQISVGLAAPLGFYLLQE